MSYQLVGADRDMLTALVIEQKVKDAVYFVEDLVELELKKASGKVVQPVQNIGAGAK